MVVASILIPIILFLALSVVPVFEIVGLSMGLDFWLYNEMVVVIVQSSLALIAMIAILIMRPEYGVTGKIFWMLLTPLALINAICFTESQWAFSILFAIFWSICCFVIYLNFVPDSVFKAISAVFSVLLAVALVVLYLIYSVFIPATDNSEITESFVSPNGEIVAEEKAVDGIISDSMIIEVHKINPEIEAVLGYYEQDSIVVYEGEAYETETAKISWKDDSTLIINDVEYNIVFE